QLEIEGEVIEQEDINLKLLRSLLSEWKTHALIWRNKAEIETTNNLSDVVICAFLASQPNSPQLAREDLEQIELDDLEEMDLHLENPTENALISQDGIGGYDWSYQAEEEHPTKYALMALTYSGSSSSSDFEVDSCSKTCLKAYATLKEQYDSLSSDYKKSQFNLVSYKTSLHSVEERLVHYKKNEVVFEEKINILNLEVRLRDNALVEYTKKLEKAEKERDELQLPLEKYQNLSKSLNSLLKSQVSDKVKIGLGYKEASPVIENFVNSSKMIKNQENVNSRSDKGYHAVLPPYTGNYIPPKPNLMFIDEQVKSESVDVVSNVSSSPIKIVESKVESVDVKNKGVYSTIETKPVKKYRFSHLIIKDWISNDESEVKKVNGQEQIQALVDKQKVIIMEESIRCDLKFDDAEGIACLTNDTIFEELARMSEIPIEESILTPFNDPLPSGEDSIQLNELMIFYTNLQQQVLYLEEAKTTQAKEIANLKKRVKKLEKRRKSRTAGLRRLKKDIDQDVEITLVDEAQGRMHDADMFGVDDLEGNEVIVDVREKIVEKEVSTADPVTTAGEVVTAASVEDSAAPTTATTIDKDQITLDEEVARKLEGEMKAKMEEEERIAREKDEENRAVIIECDDVQALTDADRQRKYFAAKRAEEIRNKPSTKAQKKKLAEQEQAKVDDDDSVELKRCLKIVSEDDDDDVAIEATPLSFISPTIVDYKIYREGKKSYIKIIRADGNSQNYLTFGTMFKNFNREDLDVLRSIIKERFKKINLVDNMDNLTLKTMFEPHVEDIICKYQQGAVKVKLETF
nr:hypothetical protein [Tanacetum cinerariifolium]